jgi:hypothetical protein
MREQPKASEGTPPEELQQVRERLDALAMKISALPCLSPASDEAFRQPDNLPDKDEYAELAREIYARLCESRKRIGSLRSLS